MYAYKIRREGLRAMMTTDATLKRAITRSANNLLAIAISLAPEDQGDLKRSGKVYDEGVKPVRAGEPRMTVAVVFNIRYAMAQEMRTGFLSGAAGRPLRRAPQ